MSRTRLRHGDLDLLGREWRHAAVLAWALALLAGRHSRPASAARSLRSTS
jgi:hypothetical protein